MPTNLNLEGVQKKPGGMRIGARDESDSWIKAVNTMSKRN